MITDEQLDKRAEEIAMDVLPPDNAPARPFPDGWYSREQSMRMNSYKFAIRAALEVDRESLRLLQSLGCDNSGCIGGECEPCKLCQEQDTHITTLRKRLGLTERA